MLRLITLLTVAAIGVTACGDSGPAASAQDEKAPLSIWIRKPPDKTTATTEVTAPFEDFETKLAQAAAGKKLPDIVINDTAQLGTMVKGADGEHYAVPFSAQSFALFIRKDWRERSARTCRSRGRTSTRSPPRSPRRTRTATAPRTPIAMSCPAPPSAATPPGTSPVSSVGRRRGLPRRAGRQVLPGDRGRGVGRRGRLVQGTVLHREDRGARRGDHRDHPGAPGVREREGRHLPDQPVQHGAVRHEPGPRQVRGRAGPTGPVASRRRSPRGRTST